MPTITKEDHELALQVAREYADDPDVQQQVDKIDRRYREQQAERRDSVRKLYTDRETHGLDESSLRNMRRAFDGESDRHYKLFNEQFFKEFHGVDKVVAEKVTTQLQEEYSERVWGEKISDDKVFYEAVGADFDKESELGKAAQQAALSGNLSRVGLAHFEEGQATDPVYNRRRDEWRTFYQNVFDRTAKEIDGLPVDQALLMMQQHTGVEVLEGSHDQLRSDVTELVTSVPPERRDAFFAAIAARVDEDQRKNWFKKLGERFGRSVETISDDAEIAGRLKELDLLERAIVLGENAVGRKDWHDLANEGFEFNMSDYQSPMVHSLESPYRDTLQKATLPKKGSKEWDAMTDGQRRAIERIEKEKDYYLTYKQIQDFASGVVDPAEGSNWVSKGLLGISSSLPVMALAGAGPVGIALDISAYKSAAEIDLHRRATGLSQSEVEGLAMATGIGQGMLDIVGAKILMGRFPALDKWTKSATATFQSAVTRGAVRTVGGATFEAGAEFGQDVAWPSIVESVASAIGTDIGSEYQDRFEQFFTDESMAELIPSFVLMSAFGAGVGSVRDFKTARSVLNDYHELRALGISEAAASDIRAAAVAEDFGKAQGLLREAITEKGLDTKTIQEVRDVALPKLLEIRKERAKMLAKAGEVDILPGIVKSSDGWRLEFNDGSKLEFKTHEEATDRMILEGKNESLDFHSETVNTIRQVSKDLREGRGLKYIFSMEAPTLGDKIAKGELSKEQASEVLGVAETLQGNLGEIGKGIEAEYDTAKVQSQILTETGNELLMSSRILGESVNEFRDGVMWTTMRIFDGATFLEIIEEKAEGDAKVFIKDRGMREDILQALRKWEKDTGDKLFKAVDDKDVTNRAIIEAWSAMAKAYLIGFNPDGSAARTAREMLDSAVGSSLSAYSALIGSVLKRAEIVQGLVETGSMDRNLESGLMASVGLSEEGMLKWHNANKAKSEERKLAKALEQVTGEKADTAAIEPDSGSTFSVLRLSENELEDRFSRMFSPFYRSPEMRSRVGFEMARRVAVQRRKLNPILRANRSLKDIHEEAKKREADILDEKLRTIGSEAALLSVDLTDKSMRPMLSELLVQDAYTRKDGRTISRWRGSLMSKSEAKRRGLDVSKGEWDGIPSLPSYVWGGELKPDQAAEQFGMDVGQFWEALSKEIESWRQMNRESEELNRRIADFEKEARAEARAWEEQAVELKEKVGNDKDTMLGFLRSLDAITRALPMEIRGRVGGMVQMAEKSTPAALMKQLEQRVNRIDTVLDDWLKKQIDQRKDKMFKRSKADRTKGKKPKGKVNANIHDLFDFAEETTKLTANEAAKLAEGIEEDIAKGEMTADEEAHSNLKIAFLNMFSDWKNRSTEARYTAVEEGERVWKEAYDKMKEEVREKRVERDKVRTGIIARLGKIGSRAEREAKAAKDEGLIGFSNKIRLGLTSYHGLLRYILGEKMAAPWVDRERMASYQSIDEVHSAADRLSALLTRLAGSKRKGEDLAWRLSQPSFETVEGGRMSEMEGISVLMTWAQADGRRHMEGRVDEDGNVLSSWHYSQQFVDEVRKNLSNEALAIMDHILDEYAEGYHSLNEVFKRVNGVNLPQHKNFAPIDAKGMFQQGNQSESPVSGAMNAGSRVPGSLRTRSQTIAEPNFPDAVAKYMAHVKEMAHWKAYVEFNTEARAIFGHRDVRNSIEATAGQEALKSLGFRMDEAENGGWRDAMAGLHLSKFLSKVVGNLAGAILVGRIGVVAIQSIQLGTMAAEMPLHSYIYRMGKLFSGQFDWSGVMKSEFIQRRLREMPPDVRLMMEGLAIGKPNDIKRAQQSIGRSMSGADALFTAGSYAVIFDYQLSRNLKTMDADAAREQAHLEAERITEQLAQPLRPATRSLYENMAKNPLSKAAWAFASDARKALSIVLDPIFEGDATRAFRAWLAICVIQSGMAALIRTGWRELRTPDEDKVDDLWSLQRLALATAAEPLYGLPGLGGVAQTIMYKLAGEYRPSGSLLETPVAGAIAVKNIPENWEQVMEGDWTRTLRDVEALMMAAGAFSGTAAGGANVMHLIRDLDGVRRKFSQ